MYTKISRDRNFELTRNFLFGSPDLLIEKVIDDSNGILFSELQTKFIDISRFYHRSIKRQYLPTPKHFNKTMVQSCKQ